MYRIAADVVEREHVTVSQGRVVHGDGGTPVTDDAIVLQALDRMLKIEARRAQLLGLDRPTKVEVHNEIDADFDRAVFHLQRAVDSRDLIGRAKGILAERLKVDDGAAFQMLVKSSQDTNLKLTAVAQWLTDQTRPCGCRAESDQC